MAVKRYGYLLGYYVIIFIKKKEEYKNAYLVYFIQNT